MQKASLATHGKVRYLAVIGNQTLANAATYLATLAIGGCNLILATGPAPAAAVDANAASYPAVRFVVIGPGKTQPNIAGVTESDAASTTETVRGLADTALKAGA